MIFFKNEDVEKLMEWKGLIDYIEKGLVEISSTDSDSVPPRLVIEVKRSDQDFKFYSMPAYSSWLNILVCKVKTEVPLNPVRYNKPTTSGAVLLYGADDGELQAIMETAVFTQWRTAATSVVAAKYLFGMTRDNCRDKTMAVIGAGRQGTSHIKAFQELFGFRTVKLWNHRAPKALALAAALKKQGIDVIVTNDIKTCLQDADLVVSAAFCKHVLFEPEDLKPRAHVIVLGEFYISPRLMQVGQVYTESIPGTLKEEDKILTEYNIENLEYLGKVITGQSVPEVSDKHLIFGSLGSAIVDAAAGRFVLDQHTKRSKL